MNASTLEHADYVPPAAVTPAAPSVTTPADVAPVDDQHIRALSVGERPTPDPRARARIAELLFRITGWETFSEDARGYVSRLWAEDWDSPEDAAYDDL